MLQRVGVDLWPMRSRVATSELSTLRSAQEAVSFELLGPGLVPRPYRLATIELVANSPDIATLVYRARHQRSFRLTQRLHMLTLEEEHATAQVPVREMTYRGQCFAVVPGAFVGEPIDGRRWHTTRRLVTWEQAPLICELQEVIDSGPSLGLMLRIAASVQAIPGTRALRRQPV